MHPDHSPAHAPIIKKTAAKLIGLNAVQDPYQDQTCHPEQIIQHQELFEFSQGEAKKGEGNLGLRVLCTPGHVDNHVCLLT